MLWNKIQRFIWTTLSHPTAVSSSSWLSLRWRTNNKKLIKNQKQSFPTPKDLNVTGIVENSCMPASLNTMTGINLPELASFLGPLRFWGLNSTGVIHIDFQVVGPTWEKPCTAPPSCTKPQQPTMYDLTENKIRFG